MSLGAFDGNNQYRLTTDKIWLTPEGGFAILLNNKTGGTSVKGSIVAVGAAVASSVILAPANSEVNIGVIYNAGVADGADVWVVTHGMADVLLKDGQAGVMGQWVGVSDVAGRAYCTSAPGTTSEHNREVGHCMQTISSGTGVVMRCHLHQN